MGFAETNLQHEQNLIPPTWELRVLTKLISPGKNSKRWRNNDWHYGQNNRSKRILSKYLRRFEKRNDRSCRQRLEHTKCTLYNMLKIIYWKYMLDLYGYRAGICWNRIDELCTVTIDRTQRTQWKTDRSVETESRRLFRPES